MERSNTLRFMSTKLEEIYEPIGKLVVRFQFLEMLLNFLLIDLLKQDYDAGFCITSEMSFSRLVASLVTISEVRIKDVSLIEEIRKVAGQLKICEEGRNKVIHSNYGITKDGIMRIKTTAKQRSGLKKSIYDITIQEIVDHIKEIEDANKQLREVGHKLHTRGIISSYYFKSPPL
jgi:hypothetical protein